MSEQSDKAKLIRDVLWPALRAERDHIGRLDKWYRWEHDRPFSPRTASTEYRQLSDEAQTPWLGLVVTAVAQSCYAEGYRSASESTNSQAWEWWQRNRMDARQIAVHRAALAYGTSYMLGTAGADPLTGAAMPVLRGVDPSEMTAFYEDPAADEWPQYALRIESARISGSPGWVMKLYDDRNVWRFHADSGGGTLEFIEWQPHGSLVCPVVRYCNMLDLKGRTPGEVEPLIPLAGRIDQTVFDRLIVQRFASWKVRTISGMVAPDGTDAAAEKLRLAVESILVAEDPDTRFGTLDATDLAGFIAAKDADIRDLAAVSQTPPHHLLGQMANLSAEALAAAEASLMRKVDERRHSFGESHEQTLRLAAHIAGDDVGAGDFAAQIVWKDTESRSLAQAADALGKLATMLGVPVEYLWSKIPGWTQQDVDAAKAMAEQGGGVADLMRQLVNGQQSPAVDGG